VFVFVAEAVAGGAATGLRWHPRRVQWRNPLASRSRDRASMDRATKWCPHRKVSVVVDVGQRKMWAMDRVRLR